MTPQGNWRENADSPIGAPNQNKLAQIMNSIMSWKTIFPRSGFDHSLISSIKDNVGTI